MSVTTKARNTDPATSWEAAAKADLAGSQASVLEVLHRCGPLSHSAIWWNQLDESSVVFGIWYSESRIRTATRELVDKGLVVADGTRLNGRGRHETVWRLA